MATEHTTPKQDRKEKNAHMIASLKEAVSTLSVIPINDFNPLALLGTGSGKAFAGAGFSRQAPVNEDMQRELAATKAQNEKYARALGALDKKLKKESSTISSLTEEKNGIIETLSLKDNFIEKISSEKELALQERAREIELLKEEVRKAAEQARLEAEQRATVEREKQRLQEDVASLQSTIASKDSGYTNELNLLKKQAESQLAATSLQNSQAAIFTPHIEVEGVGAEKGNALVEQLQQEIQQLKEAALKKQAEEVLAPITHAQEKQQLSTEIEELKKAIKISEEARLTAESRNTSLLSELENERKASGDAKNTVASQAAEIKGLTSELSEASRLNLSNDETIKTLRSENGELINQNNELVVHAKEVVNKASDVARAINERDALISALVGYFAEQGVGAEGLRELLSPQLQSQSYGTPVKGAYSSNSSTPGSEIDVDALLNEHGITSPGSDLGDSAILNWASRTSLSPVKDGNRLRSASWTDTIGEPGNDTKAFARK